MFHRTLHQELPILDLATSFTEDEFGNFNYIFETGICTIFLDLSTLDGDTSIRLIAPGQDEPLVDLELVGCKGIRVVDDKRGQYLEVIGQHRIEEYSRGKLKKTAGFRLRIEPIVSIEPFYNEDNE